MGLIITTQFAMLLHAPSFFAVHIFPADATHSALFGVSIRASTDVLFGEPILTTVKTTLMCATLVQ